MLQYKCFDLSMWSDDHKWSINEWHESIQNQDSFECFDNIVDAMGVVESPKYVALVQPENPRIRNGKIIYNKMKIIHLEEWMEEDEIAFKSFIESIIDSNGLNELIPNPVITATAYPVIADVWNVAEMAASKTIFSMGFASIEEKASAYAMNYDRIIRECHNFIVDRGFKS